MTPERWRQIEELYHSAREREPGERSAFLDQACRGDVELRREVEVLLAQGEETAGMLKVSPETVMRDWRAAKAWLHQELERSDDA